jgi:hypothetical protein
MHILLCNPHLQNQSSTLIAGSEPVYKGRLLLKSTCYNSRNMPHLPYTPTYSAHMLRSFAHWTSQSVWDYAGIAAPHSDAQAEALALYHAPFALVSHGTETDPIFCYANLTAQQLWQMGWGEFTRTPSRHSAEPVTDIQGERNALLAQALARGWVDNYEGIRIASTGQRFAIERTVLWNVVDDDGQRIGQAALIRSWRAL